MRTKVMLIAAIVALTGLLAAPASGAPLVWDRDRSDNTYYFEYDPSTGQIGMESSSLVFKRRDPVAFFVYIRESAGAEGQRLKANLGLTLNNERAVRYDGTFSVVVRDDSGALVLKKSVDRKIVLRPQKGQRRTRFSIPFDLENYGLNYEAKATFRAN